MKAKLNFILCTMLLLASMAFAASGKGYYTLTKNKTYNSGMYMAAFVMPDSSLTLERVDKDCVTVGPAAKCLASVEATPENLYKILEENWVKAPSNMSLSLGSNIDLGQIAADGSCSSSHKPLPFRKSSSFIGNGKTISNMCISATEMSAPMGFFESIDSSYVANVKFENVRIDVKSESDLGGSYYPVGALAGMVSLSSVDSVSVSDVSIDAPFAGGVVGLVGSSTLTDVVVEDASIGNTTLISSGYTGSKVMGEVFGASSNTNFYVFKVFLGGVAGLVYRFQDDPSFVGGSVSATVKDYAYNNSALGGVAGILASSEDSVSGMKVSSSEIAGGTAMGGLFGFVSNYYEYSHAVSGSIKIQNSSFSGSIGEGATSRTINAYDRIYAGGLVGFNFIDDKSQLVISNSQASLDLNDSLKIAGPTAWYRYYAGGILGAGNRCDGSNDGSTYVTVKNSHAKGGIKIASPAAAVQNGGETSKNLRMEVFVGGIAGEACFASNGWGLVGDTVSMDIDVNTKTAFDTRSSIYDSVLVGGLVGNLMSSDSSAVVFADDIFKGHIVIADSLNSVFVGGLVGAYPSDLATKRGVDFKNVYVESVGDLITLNAVDVGTFDRSGDRLLAAMGGACGYCTELRNVEKVAVVASGAVIKTSGVFAGDSLILGGMVGLSNNTTRDTKIAGTYSIGNILNQATVKTAKVLQSYIVASQIHSKTYSIKSCYHYGDEDLDLGPFGEQSPVPTTENWAVNPNISYVIRNGSEKNANASENGVWTAASMKTKNFAATLNSAFDGETEAYLWSYETGSNGNLPFFAQGSSTAASPENVTTYSVSFWHENTRLGDVQTIKEGLAATAPDTPAVEGYTFKGWDKDFSVVTSDLNVKAVYVIDTFTVTFYDYNDTIISGPTKVTYGGSVKAPKTSVLTRMGYTFDHWDDSSYTEVKDTLKIHAVYALNVHEIVYLSDSTVVDSQYVDYGAEIELKPGVEKAANEKYAYTFDKWAMLDETESIPADMPDSAITLVAVFDSALVKYTVSFLVNGEVFGDAQSVEYGSGAETPSDPVVAGMVFKGWDVAYTNVTGNLNVNAVFDTMKYNVVFRDYNDNIVHEAEYLYGADLSRANSMSLDRRATDEYVYTFKGWSQTLGLVTADIDVKAVYDSIYVAQVPSSSSMQEEVASSSSEPEKIQIVNPTLDQSGNSIRLTFDMGAVDEPASVTVLDELGVEIATAAVTDGFFELTPAPKGKSYVTVEVAGKIVYQEPVDIKSEVVVHANSWQMVSVAALDVSAQNDTSMNYYWWDETNPVGEYWQYRSYNGGEVQGTRGYWAGAAKETVLPLREVEGSADSVIVWELENAYSGWNLVANPYGWYVSLENVKTENGAAVQFWHWNAEKSDYEIPTVIGPYEAVWAKVSKSTTCRLSAAPVYNVESKVVAEKKVAMRKAAARKASASNWTLGVTLSDEYGKMDSWNVLGAGNVAETMEEAPAGMGNRVNLSIRESEKGAKLAKSIKAAAESYEWFLDVSANTARDGKLEFDGVEDLNELGYALYVTVDGVTKEVKSGEAQSVSLKKSAQSVSVRVVAANSVAVASTRLSGFSAVQDGGSLQVGFMASEALASANGQYALVGVNGKVLARGNFTANAGSNTFSLNAPKSGVYFMQVKVGSQKMGAKVLVK